ncbi:MAG: hypothetical protein KA436_07720 [Oligoflexales bacterium]|nr:hypothetical protein [Oligoflexales bacterium]
MRTYSWLRLMLATALFFSALLAFFMIASPSLLKLRKAPVVEPVSKQDFKKKDDGSLFYKSIGSLALRPREVSTQSTPPKSQYTLEFSAVQEPRELEKALGHFEKLGIPVYHTPLQSQGRVSYHIRQGLYGTEEAAKKASGDFKKQNIESSIIRL